jgi:hypothetical protein
MAEARSYHKEADMNNGDLELNKLFQAYRLSCPDVEPSSDFMPRIWAKIENTRSFPFVFQRFARTLVTVSAGTCLLLAALNMVAHRASEPAQGAYASYTDVLAADTVVERTYYSDAVPDPGRVPSAYRH